MFPSPSFDEDTYDHDVFLNFCGQDTRNGFTSNLYKSLKKEGVKAFMDDNGIGKREKIPFSHSNAIRKSRIAIVVFSQNYAYSTFCLEKLVLIYERYTEEKMTVFPVFYDVHPAVVRSQKGSYGTAFEKYEQGTFKHDKYSTALCELACLHGWHLKQRGEVDEPNLISEITAEVRRVLKTGSLNEKGKKCITVPEHSKALNLTPYMSPQIKEVIPSPSSDDEATYDHDVFLSFRGPDTRTGFTSFLYHFLDNDGVKTFKDDDGIQRGEQITLSLSNAIRKSRIAIVVFSENYASSTFCLDELALIYEGFTEEKMKVFPVFYDVDPSIVRYQKASYGTAFAKHEQGRFDKYRLQKWRTALCELAGLYGWHFKQGGGEEEPKLISKITAKVRSELKTWSLNVKGKKNTVPRNLKGKAKGSDPEISKEKGKALNLTPYMPPCSRLPAPSQTISQITSNYPTNFHIEVTFGTEETGTDDDEWLETIDNDYGSRKTFSGSHYSHRSKDR